MKVFRRSRETESPSVPLDAAGRWHAGTQSARDSASYESTGPVLVAVNGGASGWEALAWAAAEAAARRSPLRIVHVITWSPPLWDPLGSTYVNHHDAGVEQAGELVLYEAASRARAVASDLQISTVLMDGGVAKMILEAGRQHGLIVLGRGRATHRQFLSFSGSVSRQVARRATSPVALVELFDEGSEGSSAARVVVGIGNNANVLGALAFGFRAAQRRRVGITVLHATTSRVRFDLDEQIGHLVAVESALRLCQDLYPNVDVRQRQVASRVGSALVAESIGAALVVLDSRPLGRLHRPLRGSMARTVVRLAEGPVAIIGV